MSTAKCRKFVPNIFNKSKCQDCFAPKELHSAEALESNKSSRKVSKCGYLFVAPDYDFTNPMDRTRRWQRRFFILYDDGELTFSVDENPDTVPQGCVDMNKCLDVHDAEGVTTHKHSMCVSSQDKTYYIKGSTKEEISRWFDILVMYPRSNIKTKRRAPSIHNLAEKENQQDGKQSKNQQNLSESRKPLETSTMENKTFNNSRFTVICHGPGSIDKGKPRVDATPFTTHRGVRSLKHKNDKAYQEGLRKSNSMYDLTEDNSPEEKLVHSRFRSRSRDRLDDLKYMSDSNPYATLPRTLRSTRLELYGSSEGVNNKGSTNAQGSQTPASSHDRSRSATVSRDQTDSTSITRQSGVGQQKGELTHEELVGSRGNETDELKMAKSWEVPSGSCSQSTEGIAGELSYAKKGWLIKKGPSDTEPKKHWFVLSGDSLRYFKDSRAEDSNQLEGRIDLSTCYSIADVPSIRNYGFSVKNQNGEYLLSAMTLGIRNNWMKSLSNCVEYNKQRTRSSLSSESSSSVDRSPRDDVDLTRSTSDSSFKRISGLRDTPTRKLDTAKPVRRHYSDLNLRSVGDMVLVDDINIGSAEPSTTGVSRSRSREILRKTRRSLTNDDTKHIKLHFLDNVDGEKSSAMDRRSRKSSALGLHRKYSGDQDDLTSSKPPFRRYVEGSDSVGVSVDNLKGKTGRVDDIRGGESVDSLPQRAKSPSTRVKEKTRSKSPRLQSPPPDSGSAESEEETDIVPRSSQLVRKNRQSPENDYDTSSKNNVVVDLLEAEVKSLKNQLEKTQSELQDVQISNSELKSHLHTVGHQDSLHLVSDTHHSGQDETDTSFDYSVDLSASQSFQRKQNRDSQDTIRRQKTEIDTLKSKLEISLSKLTKTEQELAKAVNNLRQEKEKFLRLSDDWNARIKTLEDQLRDTASCLDAKREELSSKESENKRLANDIKSSLEKLRNSEREILKLKAVERDYKATKEQLDNTECQLASAKAKLREHDLKLRKVEDEYEKQLEDIERQFCGDREDLEQQLESVQNRLVHVHRQSAIADNVNSGMKDILLEKDEIISQLEEKVIETDDKMEKLSKKLESFDRKTSKAEQTASTMEEQNRDLQIKLKRAEKELTLLKVKKKESESAKQTDSTKKGKNQAANEIESLKAINRNLCEQNEALEASIFVLNDRVSDLEGRCETKQKEVDVLLKTSGGKRPGSGDVLHRYDQVMDEMKQVKSKLIHLEHVIQDYSTQHRGKIPEDKLRSLTETTSMLGELQKRLEVTNQALKETTLLVDDSIDNPSFQHKITVSGSSGPQAILEEYLELKKKFDKAVFEIKKLKQEVKETEANFVKLETNEKLLREQKASLEKEYQGQVKMMNSRVNDLSTKLSSVSGQSLPYPTSNTGLSQELYSQLKSLEHNIEFVENAMKNQDTETANLQQQIGLVEQQVERTQEEPKVTTKPRLLPETPTSPTNSQQLTAKLKQMKLQLESTNFKMKDITSKMGDQASSQVELKSLKQKEMKLQEQILKYEDNLRQFNQEISNHTEAATSSDVGSHLHEVELHLSQTESTLENCRSKLSSIIHIVESYQSKEKQHVGAESLAVLKERLTEVMAVACCPVGVPEQQILKDISDKGTALSNRVIRKQAEFSQLGPLSENQKQCLYSEKLACEAVILGELSYLIQKQDTKQFNSTLLKEIQDANFRLFKLEQQLGIKSDSPESSLDLDVLGSYADLIADKIVMQGKLSTLTASKSEELRHSSVMLSEGQDPETSILAEEVLVRSQIQESMNSQIKNQALEPVESYAGHLMTRALIQGEITFALAQMKNRIGTRMTDKERLEMINQELSQALGVLNHRQVAMSKSVAVFRREKISKLAETLAIETLNNVSGGDLQSRQAAICELVTVVMNGVRDQYLKDWSNAQKDSSQQEKETHLQKALKEEFQSTFSELKSKYSNILSTMTAATSKGQSLKQEIKTGLAAFSAVLAQYAAVVGSTRYLISVHKRKNPESGESSPSDDSTTESVQRMRKILGEALMKEACTKEARATDLRNKVRASTGQIAELSGQVPELAGWRGEALAVYAETLLREAVFQAELTFSSLKLKMHHREELQQLHEYYEAKYGRIDANESVAESYAECELFLAKPEGTLEEEHSKVAEAMKSVEVVLKKLKTSLKSSSAKDVHSQADALEKLFKQAMSVVKKTQEETTNSVMKDIKDAKGKVEEIIEDHEREKESLVAEYEDRIAQLEEEIDAIKEDHESEFDQLKQDMFTAVSAIRASEVQSEADMSNEIMRLRHQLSSQRAKVMMELKSMRSSIPHSQRNTKLSSALLGKIQNVEHILAGFKSGSQESLLEIANQDFSSSSTDEESDDDSSEMSDGGEEIEEPRGARKIDTRVHKRVLLRMHERHKSQLSQLRKEKDKALEDEMKSTKAALEAMSKKYEEELQTERDKFGDALTKLYTNDDMSEISKRHGLEVEHLKEELTKIKEKFKKKTDELKDIQEKVFKSNTEHRKEIRQLSLRNDQLNSTMTKELDKLRSLAHKGAEGSSRASAKPDKEELYNQQVLSRVKDTEVKQVKEQMKVMKDRLQKAQEAQEQTSAQYSEMYNKYQALSTDHEVEVEKLKRKLEQALLGFRGEGKKGLRRVSSFNQRDRSPSPQRGLKKEAGHVSRDGQRRRHRPRDLRRSKSSPSLPSISKLPMIKGKSEEVAKSPSAAGGLLKSTSSRFSKP